MIGKLSLVGGLLLFTTSCITPAPSPTAVSAKPAVVSATKIVKSPSETERLLDEFALIRTYPKEQVAKEYADASRELSQAGVNSARIKLAWLLALPGTSFQDLNRSAALLQEAMKDEAPDDMGVKRLATLLYAQVTRDIRYEDNAQVLNQRLREEQKRVEAGGSKHEETIATLTGKLKEEQKKLEALQLKHEESAQSVNQITQKMLQEQKRADLLQQKLDALTNIEKTIVDRQQAPKPEPKK